VIFDSYTVQLRRLMKDQADAPDELLLEHLERKTIVDGALDEMAALSAHLPTDARGLARRAGKTEALRQFPDVAKAAGVRVSIELHALPRGS
jgi:hypothetical protein